MKNFSYKLKLVTEIYHLCLDVWLNDFKKTFVTVKKKGQVYVEKQGHHVHLSINGMTTKSMLGDSWC